MPPCIVAASEHKRIIWVLLVSFVTATQAWLTENVVKCWLAQNLPVFHDIVGVGLCVCVCVARGSEEGIYHCSVGLVTNTDTKTQT